MQYVQGRDLPILCVVSCSTDDGMLVEVPTAETESETYGPRLQRLTKSSADGMVPLSLPSLHIVVKLSAFWVCHLHPPAWQGLGGHGTSKER